MKLLKIKLYCTHYKETIHKAFAMCLLMIYLFFFNFVLFMFFVHQSRTNNIGRFPSPVILRRPHSLNIFLVSTGPIEVKDHMKPSQDGETKVCIIGQGRITNMAAMTIYGKNLKDLLQNH